MRWLVDADATWKATSLRLLHRYVYVVEVLMEGCGWDVRRPKELMGLLGGRDAVAAALEDEWGDGPASITAELRRLGLGGGGGDGDGAVVAAKAKGGKKKGKGKQKGR